MTSPPLARIPTSVGSEAVPMVLAGVDVRMSADSGDGAFGSSGGAFADIDRQAASRRRRSARDADGTRPGARRGDIPAEASAPAAGPIRVVGRQALEELGGDRGAADIARAAGRSSACRRESGLGADGTGRCDPADSEPPTMVTATNGASRGQTAHGSSMGKGKGLASPRRGTCSSRGPCFTTSQAAS
jgi:hypothetical protein